MSPATIGPVRVCMLFRNAFTHDTRGRREAISLTRAGHDVTVIAVRSDASLPAREERDGFVVERIQVTGRLFGAARALGRERPANGAVSPASPTSSVRSVVVSAGRTTSTALFDRKAARRAAELRPDVYHCRDLNTIMAGIMAANHAPAPIIYDSNELYAHLNVPHPTRLRRFAVEALEGRAIRRAASVITVSDAIANHLARRYGIPKPTVVLNVPEAPVAGASGPVPEPLRADGVKLIYLGGIMPRRGIEQAIDALAMLPGARLVLMGPVLDPAYEKTLIERAADAHVGDRLFVLPPVPADQVIHVASHATLGLATIQNTCLSHYYSLPNKLFEYFHASLPVVASDFPEIRRVIDEHRAGRTCDPALPSSIAAAVRDVVGDPTKYETMRRGASAAAAEYTWEREAPKLLAVYDRLFPVGAKA